MLIMCMALANVVPWTWIMMVGLCVVSHFACKRFGINPSKHVWGIVLPSYAISVIVVAVLISSGILKVHS